MRLPFLLPLIAALLTAPFATAQPLAPAPEAATGRSLKALGTAQRFMAAAANPLAASAGRDILRAGGSATDAAIAIQLVLNLVEPQSSGIGGGSFFVHWDEAARKVTTLDGRETAPAAAKPDRFMRDGKPMPFREAVIGGRSVGVPGTLRLLEDAHRRWGKLPWVDVIAPALKLAEDGFAVSPRLNGLLAAERDLPKNALAAAYFYEPDGKPKAVGSILKNPAFATTLRAVASQGAKALYEGPIAEDIVATVTSHPSNPGDMTLADLAGYKIEEREPVCGSYRIWRLCGMGPPSSGAVAIQQMLGALEGQDLRRMGPGAEAAHWFSEAGRLAFADRALYLADPAFINVPVRGLIDRDYIRSRAGLISPERSMGRAKPGDPPHRRAGLLAPSDGIENGTSHISVVDADGNAVAMTTTIEDGFGSRLMTGGGFLLNNEMTDFNFAPEEDGKPVANRVEAGKRPRSSMAPTLVFDAFGRLYAVVGSPGGSQIIGYVGKTLVALLDWKMDPQQAVDFGNFGSRNGPTELEKGTEAEAWKAALEAKGHEVRLLEMTSGTQAIVKTPEGFLGGADGRREGVAIGD
ncbi:Gamma-glutamyltranspeptidase [Hyphomicrobiales bacterium]|nr:Gamma-glutamyltranspeptidase [Hyphomicrobiales bacterium]CAH1698278.1 Gamma-glutamyltranspeptidase [Hyphomicrobiales bacterium]CAI0341944.1 gamma-glutamyltranspeptidase / glutathione hydrolase [Hyphomicrobiales bacterium]